MEIYLMNGGSIYLPFGDSVDIENVESVNHVLVVIYCEHGNPIMSITAQSVKKIILDDEVLFSTKIVCKVEKDE